MAKKSAKKPARRKPLTRKKPIRRVASARKTLKQAAAFRPRPRPVQLPGADPRQLGMPWAPPPMTEEQRRALLTSPGTVQTIRTQRLRAAWWQAAARKANARDWKSWAIETMDGRAAQLVGPMPSTEDA